MAFALGTLTGTDATGKFWFANAVTSDWKVGLPVTFHCRGKRIVKGEVLEYDPARRLAYTFPPQHDQFLNETYASRVVLDLGQLKDQVKLTVTHNDFAGGSKVFESISNGWLLMLSSLRRYFGRKPCPLRTVV